MFLFYSISLNIRFFSFFTWLNFINLYDTLFKPLKTMQKSRFENQETCYNTQTIVKNKQTCTMLV